MKKRIVITGAESSGKTTLAQAISSALKVPFLPEASRVFFHNRPSQYTLKDVEAIAELHLNRAKSFEQLDHPIFLYDTDLLNIYIWIEDKFNQSKSWIIEELKKQDQTHYLVTRSNIPWEKDPLREDPKRRGEIESKHLFLIKKYELSFSVISGSPNERLTQSLEIIKQL